MTTAFQSGAFQDDAFQIDAAPSTNYTLTCLAGSYTVSGQTATLLRSKSITAQAGSYAETGVDATLKVDKKLTAQAGSYSLSGQSATITRTGGTTNYTLTCQAGEYLIGADYWNDGYAEPGYAGNAVISIGAAQTIRAYGTRKGYIIKGKKYFLTQRELEQVIAKMLAELKREDIVVDEQQRIIPKRAWKAIQKSISKLDALVSVEPMLIDDEDDEEALLMLL